MYTPHDDGKWIAYDGDGVVDELGVDERDWPPVGFAGPDATLLNELINVDSLNRDFTVDNTVALTIG